MHLWPLLLTLTLSDFIKLKDGTPEEETAHAYDFKNRITKIISLKPAPLHTARTAPAPYRQDRTYSHTIQSGLLQNNLELLNIVSLVCNLWLLWLQYSHAGCFGRPLQLLIYFLGTLFNIILYVNLLMNRYLKNNYLNAKQSTVQSNFINFVQLFMSQAVCQFTCKCHQYLKSEKWECTKYISEFTSDTKWIFMLAAGQELLLCLCHNDLAQNSFNQWNFDLSPSQIALVLFPIFGCNLQALFVALDCTFIAGKVHSKHFHEQLHMELKHKLFALTLADLVVHLALFTVSMSCIMVGLTSAYDLSVYALNCMQVMVFCISPLNLILNICCNGITVHPELLKPGKFRDCEKEKLK